MVFQRNRMGGLDCFC